MGRRLRRLLGWIAMVLAVAITAACVPPEQPGGGGGNGGGPSDPPDDPPPTSENVEIDITGLFPNTTPTLSVLPGTAHVVELTALEPGQLDNQCFALGGESMCLGGSVNTSFTVQSEATTERFLKGGDAVAALQWMVDEGAQAVAAMYDLPSDVRVERFARPEIRSYMVARLLDILDKASYGMPLNDDEQRALEFLQRKVLEEDRVLATYAHEEHARFMAQGCAYTPPPAPSYVTSPLGVPQEWLSWCALHGAGIGAVFAPPLPSVEHFQTWGFYRAAPELGLANVQDPQMQAHLQAVAYAGTFLGGLATAAGAAALTAKAVGLSKTLAGAILSTFHPFAKSALAATAVGAASGAALVATVVIALVAIGIAVWQLVEREEIGATLTARMNAARNATDPFGLEALAAQNENRDLDADRETWTTEATLPRYRRKENVSRLTELVTRWSTVRPNGQVAPDPSEPWPANATTTSDFRFAVSEDAGPETVVNELAVPVGGTTQRVRFNQSWPLVTRGAGQPVPQLSFSFVDPDGITRLASRRTAPDGSQQFLVIDPDEGATGAELVDSISYRDAEGDVVTVRLVGPPSVTATDLRPGVLGRMLPGVTLKMSPNPVDGQGFNRLPFIEDYTYDWSVERFDEATQQWVPQSGLTAAPHGGNETYGAYFTPSAAGRHRAKVVMHHNEGLVDDLTGVVEFTVAPPVMMLRDVTAIDEAWNDQLRLSFQILEDGPSDQFDITVQWPGQLGSNAPGPVETRTGVTCIGTFPCATTSQVFTHPTTPMTEFRDEITITVTNAHGAEVTTAVTLETPWRPGFAPPDVEPSTGQDGVVTFDPYVVHLSVPAWDGHANGNYRLATMVPGYDPAPGTPKFSLKHPVTGSTTTTYDAAPGLSVTLADAFDPPKLSVRSHITPEGIGTYFFPVTVGQDNGVEATIFVQVDVVPAPGDRYRASATTTDLQGVELYTDTVPDVDLALIGGRAEWGAYDGELCVGLKTQWAFPTYCDDVSTFFNPDGTSKPFPYERLLPDGITTSDGVLEARAWLPDSDRSWSQPTQVNFGLNPGYGPPSIDDLRWEAGQAVLAVSPHPSGAAITSVTCRVDGGAEQPCFSTSGGTWTPAGLAPGAHELKVLVKDARRNYTTGTLDFTV